MRVASHSTRRWIDSSAARSCAPVSGIGGETAMAEALPFGDGSFDVALSTFGVDRLANTPVNATRFYVK